MPGVASHPGLIITSDPFDASLDTLWRNELNLSVNGPEGFAVRVRLKLHTADGQQLLSNFVGDSMPIPITPDAWRRTFAKFLDNETRAWKYLEAANCTLEINGDSLGTCALSFDHDPSPLRWALTSRQRQTFIHLVDDSGLHDSAPNTQFFSMDRPLDSFQLDAETARAGFPVEPPGGLFLSRHPPFDDAAVVSAPPARLEGLGIEPHVQVSAGAPAVRRAFDLLRLWHNARQAGFLVNVRRQQVTQRIFDAIFRSICGANWARAEGVFVRQPSSPDALLALQNLVDRRTRFGSRLVKRCATSESDGGVAVRFTAEAGRLRVSQDRQLCHFALRFAARRDDVLTGQSLDDSVAQLAGNPVLLRGARLACLLREHPPKGWTR